MPWAPQAGTQLGDRTHLVAAVLRFHWVTGNGAAPKGQLQEIPAAPWKQEG